MEQINLSSNGKDIQRAYEKVVKDEPDFSWVIYGPDASKAYQVAATGLDFDEFLDSFDDSQIQFGLARITPPGSDVKKNLLVGWCPDSAPLKSRSSFAQNFAEVSKLLKGYHVQITARDSDDLDRDELLSRLSAAAGARYSIQASRSNTASSVNPTPVSRPVPTSAPKPASKPSPTPAPAPKPVPHVIKPKPVSRSAEDEDEWHEPELEERDFHKNPLTPNVSAYKPIGRVNLQEVIKAENAKVDPRLEIEELRKKDRLKKDAELDEYLKTKPADFVTKAPSPAPSFAAKSDKVVGGISKSFGTENGKTPAQIWAEKKLKEQGKSIPASTTKAPAAVVADDEIDEEHEESVSDLKSKFEHFNTEDDESPVPVPGARRAFPPPPVRLPVQEEKEPEPAHEEEEQPEEVEEPQSEDEVEEKEDVKPTLPSRGAVPPPPARTAAPEPESDDGEEEEQAHSEQEDEPVYIAIAEYDYDASEDNELTFKEGDKIVIIDFVDEDWWLGEIESGDRGLFPSNYVTLQE